MRRTSITVLLTACLCVVGSPVVQAVPPVHLQEPYSWHTAFTDCPDPVVGHFDVVESATFTIDAAGEVTGLMRHVLGEVTYRNERTGAEVEGQIVRNHRQVFGSARQLPGGVTEITIVSSGLISMVVVPGIGISHLIAGRATTIFTLDSSGELIGKVRGQVLAGRDDDGFALPDKICEALT